MGATALILRRAARTELAAELARAVEVLEALGRTRESLLRSELRVVSEEPRLKAVIASEDATEDTITGVVTEMRKVLRADLLLLADEEGIVLGSSGPVTLGTSPAFAATVRAAWQAREASALSIVDGVPYWIQARSVLIAGRGVGVVASGYRMEDWVARTTHHLTGVTVVIVVDRRPVASSRLSPALRGDLPDALRALDGGHGAPRELRAGGRRYLGRMAKLPGHESDRRIGVVLLRDMDEALAPARRLIAALGAIFGVTLLAAVAFAVILSRRLSRPLDDLVAMTRHVAAGELSARASVEGPIEVRALGASMNRMVAELAESRSQMAAKERLEREVEIAAHIQSALLPRRCDVPGLEIAARMLPATRVGGDYFDVIPTESGCFIGIGDVAGHGLTSGLIMLMVQTGIATLVAERPDRAPRDIVRIVSRSLYENIHDRLQQRQHVTLLVLRYHQSGIVDFAGAHEEIVVLRRGANRADRLPTFGPLLATTAELPGPVAEGSIVLSAGDLLVLYSDGLREALDTQNREFGIRRLCAAIEAAREGSVEEIRDHVLDTVARWQREQDDDRTLIVVRRRDDA